VNCVEMLQRNRLLVRHINVRQTERESVAPSRKL
jgi:hypothetical protein